MSFTVRRSVLCLASGGVVVGVIACSDSTSPTVYYPALNNVVVSANPHNVLSTIINFTGVGTDSVRVVYTSAVDPGGATPWQRTSGIGDRIVTLGLLPNVTYTEILQAAGRHHIIADTLHVTTTDLPAYVKTATLTQIGTYGPGYTLVSPIVLETDTTMAVAFDSIGRVRWYREFVGYSSVDVKMQRNGHYTVCLGEPTGASSSPSPACPYVELLPSGDSIASYSTPAGHLADGHELLMTGTASTGVETHMYGFDAVRVSDLTALGGKPDASVYGHTLFRQAANGDVLFTWDTWDHFSIVDWIEPTCCAANDYDHPNSLDIDTDSNYIMSYRHFGAIVKIDRTSGTIIWQLGGRLNQFTFVNDPLGFFSGQHYVRRLANGHIMLYDNGLRHVPKHTRVVEYALDEGAKTATMVWEYEPQPMVFTPYVGSAQRLSNGNTLVGFGAAGQIDEVDASAHVLARSQFHLNKSRQFYRALRIPSLYEYQTP